MAGHTSIGRRLLAILALVATASVVIALIVFLLRNLLYVLLGVAGLMLVIASGWWVITKPTTRRALGFVGAGGGAVMLVLAILGVGGGTDHIALRLAVVVGLVAIALFAARSALTADLREVARRGVHRAPPPSHPVLICNLRSGGGKVQRYELIELARSLGVETAVLETGVDLKDLALDAIDRGADCLGMAGGDGSQAYVASIAVQHDLPFVCVSAGTRNHFALDLGLDRNNPRASVFAFRDAIDRRVDFATVNGRFFVNNVSLGIYAAIVQQESYRDAKADTTKKLLPELLGRTDRPFDLQFTTPDGVEVDGSFLIMVSNNPYVLGAALDTSQRRRMDSGRLGIFAVCAATGVQAAEVITLALARRSSASGQAFEFTTPEFEVSSRSGRAHAGIDGEALELDTPLAFRIHPRGLRMLVPEGNLEAAVRRQAREVRIRDLLSIAGGVPSQSARSSG